MNDDLRYVKIDNAFDDLDRVEALYTNAFPAEERFFTVREVLQHMDEIGEVEMIAVYDGDEPVGFYAVSVNSGLNYKYLQFIAVNTAIRNKGYGSRILKKLLDDNKDIVFFASIEKPDPDGENYEIKCRRQQFYERNGMISVDRERQVNGVRYIVVTNKTGEVFDRCYEHEVLEEKKQVEMAAQKS